MGIDIGDRPVGQDGLKFHNTIGSHSILSTEEGKTTLGEIASDTNQTYAGDVLMLCIETEAELRHTQTPSNNGDALLY